MKAYVAVAGDAGRPARLGVSAGILTKRLALALVIAPAVSCLTSVPRAPHPTVATAPAHRTLALVNGHWLIHGAFLAEPRYVVDDVLRDHAAGAPDSTIDLHGGFVVPPFGEAHNHNIEASPRIGAVVARYVRDGVLYVENPDVLPRSRAGLVGSVNVPSGPDVVFADGGLTGSGGHPIDIVARNITRGIWTATDGEGAFYWVVDDRGDLDRKWPAILSQQSRPDFIKVYLLHSEEYARRRSDSSFGAWRGLDPALVPDIVRRAHAASLRVAAHVETAADFRAAVGAGVDQVAHIPGFRGDEHGQLADPRPYQLTDADAREAARRGVVVVTTLGGAAALDPTGADSVRRRAFDDLARHNLLTLRRAGVRVAIGSDSYADDSRAEAAYLHSLGVFSDAELVRMWAEVTPRAIFPDRAVGRLDDGAEGSFLVLACDPFASFACTGEITLRVKDGRVLPARAG